MIKVAFNDCYGGFNLSREAVLRAREISGDPHWGGCILKGEPFGDGTVSSHDYGHIYGVSRADPVLIQVIEELGAQASGEYSDLKIAGIAAGTKYRIHEYDGNETVMSIDDYDWSIA